MASIRYTVRIRLNVVRSVHVAQFNGVHTTLDSGVVRTVQVAKTRWCPYDTRLCRETRWRPYDTQCTFIRHYISASCELCTSCNQTASIRQILRIRLDIMRTVHVAKTTWCPYDTCLCRETRWRPYDTQYMGRTVHIAQFTGGHATLTTIRHAVDVYMTYISASSVLCTSRNSQADMRHTVHVRTTCELATCVLCTSQNQMTFKRH